MAFSAILRLVSGLSLGEPPDGRAYLGAWTDGSDPYLDSPSAINRRVGKDFYAFQFAQTIPVTPYDPNTGAGGPINITQLVQVDTPAALFLTVYPQSLNQVTDQALDGLGKQILEYQNNLPNRQVFLRFAPEMQGDWMTYGLQPSGYLSLWRRMFTIIKNLAPNTIIVWAPNGAMGYPYAAQMSSVASKTDQELLDTNKNGQLDSDDDAYSPYYPGDSYVDWNGISWYWKGTEFPYRLNQLLPSGYSAGAMTGRAPVGAIGSGVALNFTNFYDSYCQRKPCMFAEMGAAFHRNSSSQIAPSQETLQQAWWRDTFTSNEFMDRFPKVKMFMLFEHEKPEDGGDVRDYRITTDDRVRSTWLQDFEAVQSRYIWAENFNGTQTPAGQGARGNTAKLDGSAGWLTKLLIALILSLYLWN